MMIIKGIFQVGGEGFTSPEDGAVYLINAKEQSALVDAGCGYSHKALMDNIHKHLDDISRLKLLMLTHCHFDHCGGVKELVEKLNCKTVAHEADAVYLENGDNEVTAASWYHSTLHPFHVNRKITLEEEIIDLGGLSIKAIHIPGHSPGSLVYLTELDGQRVLFGQDVHGPLHPSLKSDRTQYMLSLKKMLSLEADILCEGHFGVIRGKENVADFITSYL